MRSSERIPDFDEHGMLPPGEYAATLEAIRASALVGGGTRRSVTWDQAWRAQLVTNLGVLAAQLWRVGVERIFIDGSFVEDKDRPNDIDGYFECDRESLFNGELEERLNQLDTHRCWTWAPESRRPYRGFAKLQLPMWHVYRVELYPHYGQFSGIRDEHGHEQLFPAAFRRSRRSGRARGIVRLVQA